MTDYSFDFRTMTSLPGNISFSRSSSATYYDASGVLQTAGTNVPRFTHDPFSGAALGLLFENASTNNIRNSSAAGAVAGTPGTAPTYWTIDLNSSGLTSSIVATGTEKGIPYVQVRIYGTPTTTNPVTVYFESSHTQIASGDYYWTQSSFLRLAAGSFTNLSGVAHVLAQYDSGGTFLAFATNPSGWDQTNIIPGSWVRLPDGLHAGNASVAFVAPGLQFTPSGVGSAVDVTVQIGCPQLEGFLSSPILTTTGAATREQDNGTITGDAATLIAASSGWSATAWANFANPNSFVVGGIGGGVWAGFGVINPYIVICNGYSVDRLDFSGNVGSPQFIGVSNGATRYLTSNGGTLRGGTVSSDTGHNVGIGPQLGGASTGFNINGAISLLNLYDVALTQSELEQVTNVTQTTAWGDSLTGGTGSFAPGVNYGYIGYLQALTQQTMNGQGVGGQTSTQIASRMTADTYHVNDNVIIEAGRNNIASQETILSDIASMVAHLGANTRFAVLSIINATAENSAAGGGDLTNYNNIISVNAALAAAYPNNFVDVRSAIVTASGGANDAPAATHLYQGSVHPNDAGYQVMATEIYNFGVSKDWPGYGASSTDYVLASAAALNAQTKDVWVQYTFDYVADGTETGYIIIKNPGDTTGTGFDVALPKVQQLIAGLVVGGHYFGTPELTQHYVLQAGPTLAPNCLDNSVFTGTLGASQVPDGWSVYGSDVAVLTLEDPGTVNGIATYDEKIRGTGAGGGNQGLYESFTFETGHSYQIGAWLRVPTNVTASDCLVATEWSPAGAPDYSFTLDGPSLPSGLSFARNSTATYFDSEGAIHLASNDTPRFDYHPTTGRYLGLLIEPSTTNYLLNSLLDGTNLSTQTVTLPSSGGGNWVISFYGSGTITLSGIASATIVGSANPGNQRTDYSILSTSGGSLTLTVSGTVKWAQLEQQVGGYQTDATSFVPTAGSTATRENEYVAFTGGSFSLLNAAEGSAVVTCIKRAQDWNGPVAIISGDVANGLIFRNFDTSFSGGNFVTIAQLGQQAFAGGNTNLMIAGSPCYCSFVQKAGVRWKAGDYAVCVDGYGPGTSTNAAGFASSNNFYLGSAGPSWGSHFSGWFQKVDLYTRTIENSELQQLCALPAPALSGNNTPQGVIDSGYTTKIIDIYPTKDDIAPDQTPGTHAFYDGIYFDNSPVDLTKYNMENGVLTMPLGACLCTQTRTAHAGTLPYFLGSDGFYIEFEVRIDSNNSTSSWDRWPAVWAMPQEHDNAGGDMYPDPPWNDPEGWERWMELDVDEGGFGPNLLATMNDWQGVWGYSDTQLAWNYWRDPPTNSVFGAVINNFWVSGFCDRTQYHRFGAFYDPVRGFARWYFDDQPYFQANAPAIAAYQHFYAICSVQSHGANVPYKIYYRRLRVYTP